MECFYLETVPTVESTQKEFQVSSFHKGRRLEQKKKKKATKKKEKKKTPNQNIPQKIQTTNKKKQTTTIPVDPKVHFFAIWLNQKAVFPAAVLKVKVLQVEAS